ncbi:hypothetical protein [Bacillus subtilis]|uniref:hypothetical protein n=1 Tax=Bacillus subtilis TaxID=1423 RepID=UPI001BA03307|nr:hypothetical protein [Bacillus subtilis]CAF1803261.1 hypothetical protein NRS6141_00801 [Bacillus subtilis]CAF1876783.1 hypothetical protein NRS6204_00311 [Bacillus subtilis]CAF1878806.1 hypothetical protein NRS6205_00311 [Bacillus subtilis]
MTQFQKGAAALGSLIGGNGGGSSKKDKVDFTKLGNEPIKVRVKSPFDLMRYFAYGVHGKVNTFIAKNPPTYNDKGFASGNLTPWDKASDYYYKLAQKEPDKSAKRQELSTLGYRFRAKPRYIMGFYDLESGKDIIVDFTKKQAEAVYSTILEYVETDDDGKIIEDGEHDIYSMAFKLSKKGESTNTVGSLAPIINLSKGLTAEEQANLEASAGQPFDTSMFEGVLYEMDEEEMIKSLVKADFDISILGLTIGGSATESNEVPAEDSFGF